MSNDGYVSRYRATVYKEVQSCVLIEFWHRNSLTDRESGTLTLEHQSGMKENIQIVPRLKIDDMATLKEAAGEGLGIVTLPAYTCRDELASGKLVKPILAL